MRKKVLEKVSKIYWRGSESHNIFAEARSLTNKFRVLDTLPMSSKVMKDDEKTLKKNRDAFIRVPD